MTAVKPEIAAAWLAEAECLLSKRHLGEARTAFDRAEQLGCAPDRCAAGRWDLAMLAGDFERAWREADAIRRRGGPDPHRFWDGTPLAGKRVMVRSLHGFGDAVQMFRYAPRLRALATEVTFEVAPRLVELAPFFGGVGPAQNVITWGESAPAQAPAWDLQVEVMELPYLFRTALSDLPLETRYLQLPQSLLQQVGQHMGHSGTRRVGLVWTGGGWNPARSMAAALLRPLLANPAWEFWNLNEGGGAEDGLADLRDATAICGDGLLALAATIANLDLVITVDTLAAHLAGALGKPAWLMLQHAADWRWMDGRDDSPWFPTLRLFRQPAPGDWAGVVRAVDAALRESAGASR